MLCLVWCLFNLVESFQGAHTPPARTHQHHRWLDTQEAFFLGFNIILIVYFNRFSVEVFSFLPPFENWPNNRILYLSMVVFV